MYRGERMKEFINIEQLNEISEEKLNKIIEKEDTALTKHAKEEVCKRLFNICKMIEILDKRLENFYYDNHNNYYVVELYDVGYWWDNKEPIDALWEAIKHVLREEK